MPGFASRLDGVVSGVVAVLRVFVDGASAEPFDESVTLLLSAAEDLELGGPALVPLFAVDELAVPPLPAAGEPPPDELLPPEELDRLSHRARIADAVDDTGDETAPAARDAP